MNRTTDFRGEMFQKQQVILAWRNCRVEDGRLDVDVAERISIGNERFNP